jgi:two-component system OmpR family sensor kinase
MNTDPPVDSIDYVPPPPTAPPAAGADAAVGMPEGFRPAGASYGTSYDGEPGTMPYGQPWPVIGHDDIVESGARRRWVWRRWLPRTLTTRLVAGVVSLAVVLVLAIGICTYVALRSFLFSRLDQQVSAAADLTTPQIERCLPLPRNCLVATTQGGIQSPQRTWLAVLDASGGQLIPVQRGAVLEPLRVSTEAGKDLVDHPARARTVSTPDGDVRVEARTIENALPGTGSVTVAVGLSTSEVEHTLSRLIKLELAIGIGAIVVALVATLYGVRYSLRSLRGVTATAREVAAELSPSGRGLERRVEVDEPGTEVGQLATSMNTLLSAVETQFAERVASENRMRQFLADASHELRTPLTSIRGYAELSRMQGSGAAEDNIARIEAEGTRMSRLVDDLLTLARTDQGGERRRELLDMGEVLAEAVDGVRAAHPERRIELSAEHGLDVVGDRDQLVRVVRNLATNAAVHTRPEGPIRVSGAHEGDVVVIRVADAGPGLPPEEAAHVFERFWRADKARSRAQGGSGLGLAIVAALVQGHAGQVHFDSTVESGSTVTVRLPRA